MAVPEIIIQLVERFERNKAEYTSGRYNETETRREFIDPFFKALGWDVDNTSNYSERYKDVVHEDKVRVGESAKAPDYSFRVGGDRKFFVEAKKPSVNLKDDIAPAFQVRRYAWSAKLPVSIVTDFEELAVYDCRNKPVKSDGIGTGRVMYFTYDQYAEKWDEIAAVFSKDAVLKGDFDRYAGAFGSARGTQQVDDAFLAEIERWREELARSLALRNDDLSQRELNFAVQRIIDRIIFLRISEARGFEPYGQLRGLAQGEQVYPELVKLFRRADDRYNSGLFHFKAEKARSGYPDDLTPGLKIDDKVLKGIFRNLYYPDSPYEFSVLPSDILGQVYEQFLGKVIRLTKGHQAKVEEKPEVKKAGGVYYTPTYIVDYIVAHTVGKLLEDKTPRQVSSLRILDPACGSGSFLIGAYQYLLDWHLEAYQHSDVKADQQRIVQVGEDDWRLTVEERKRILLNNIYGVDIDSQAVEVTKLSLLLKVLEGEGQTQLAMFQERVLPDLNANIKCGNSLIGPDFYEGTQGTLFEMDAEERQRINVFDWAAEFSEIMQAGGFDAVIGNPPYIRIQAMKEWAPVEVEYYKEAYRAASKGNYDIYVVFVEKGLSLLNEKGLLGFILPHKFFNADYGEPLRSLIAMGQNVSQVVHFGDQQVFANATTYTCLLFLNNFGQNMFQYVKVNTLYDWKSSEKSTFEYLPSPEVEGEEWNFLSEAKRNIIEKIYKKSFELINISPKIFQGLITGADKVFILEHIGDNKYYSEATKRDYELEPGLLHPICKGSGNIYRYQIIDVNKFVIFPYTIKKEKPELISVDELAEKYSVIWNYLQENRKLLEKRERGKWKTKNWYAFSRNQNLVEMEKPKILSRVLGTRGNFFYDGVGEYHFVGGGTAGGNALLLDDNRRENPLYLLGILNSRVLTFFVALFASGFRGGYYAFGKSSLADFPIRTIDFDNPAEVAQHDKLVALVERMLALHQQLAAANTPHEKDGLQRQINATDAQIDSLVYALYGLTAEEIAVVEG